MHIAGADGPDQLLALRFSQGEGYEKRPVFSCTAYGDEAIFPVGVRDIWCCARIVVEKCFDLFDRYPVHLAFGQIALIPIEC